MTTFYLSRPVFTWDLDWSVSPEKTLVYDLREDTLAFSAPRYEPLQASTRSQYTGSLWLDSEPELEAWRGFMALCQGRLNGFWFPAPLSTMEIEPDLVATDQFLIKEQGLMEYWQDYPCRYLVFSKPDAPSQFAKIANVEKTLDGRELVHLEDGVETALDETWDVGKLLYARMASDEDKTDFNADNRATKNITVVELTEEYAEIETAVLDVYLYVFTRTLLDVTDIWRRTGLNQDLLSGGELFQSAALEHRNLTKSMKPNQDDLQLLAWVEPGEPLSEFVPFKSGANMTVDIYRTTWATPDVRTLIYSGRVQSPGTAGKKITANCGHRFWPTKVPRFYICASCNHFLFDGGCKVAQSSFTAFGTVFAVLPTSRVVVLRVSNPPIAGKADSADVNYFSLGWLETGEGPDTEIRTVRQSGQRKPDGTMTIRMNEPLKLAGVNQIVRLIAGCDGSLNTCDKKFNNFRRWGGHTIPDENAATDPLMDQLTEQGKKGG